MPRTEVYFWQDAQGRSPVLEALRALKARDRQAFSRCTARVELLVMSGHELRRPHADHLGQGIYELRARSGSMQLRLLYFFHGKQVAIVAHLFQKERGTVPQVELERALQRKRLLEADPETYIRRVPWQKEV